MNGTKELCGELEEFREKLTARCGPEFAAEVISIVRQNVAEGRAERLLKNDHNLDFAGYVERVAHYYGREKDYVQRLRDRDEQTWHNLLERLQKQAWNILWHPSLNAERRDHSAACAHETAAILLERRFTFDTAFDAFASVTLRYTTFDYIKKHLRRPFLEADGKMGWIESLRDSRHEDEQRLQKRQRLHLALWRSLTTLTNLQFQVIYYRYIAELDYEEIGLLMDREINTLYKLHHDALEKIRKNWNGPAI